MRTRSISVLAVALLGLAACSNDQSDVADAMVEQAADQGMTLEKSCVSPIAEEMTDADVKSLEEGSDAVTSPEGELLLARMMIECGSVEDIENVVLAALPDDGTVDKTCVAEAMKAADLSNGMEDAMIAAMEPCVGG